MKVCHLALFFKSEQPDVLFWVRVPVSSTRIPTSLAELTSDSESASR